MNRKFLQFGRRGIVIFVLLLPCAYASEVEVSYGMGLRNDDLRWAISSDLIGTPPNILSELIWRNLKGNEHFLGLEYVSSDRWMVRANLSKIEFNQGGEMQDSDYLYDDRNGEFSRSIAATRGSNAQDISLIFGKQFLFTNAPALTLTPVIGWARNLINLRMNEGVQIIPASGAYIGLNSSYQAQFNTNLAGVEAKWWLSKIVGFDIKWHHGWFNYHGEADWNLRSDFQHPVSFYHEAKGTDNRWRFGLLTKLNSSWNMEISYSVNKGAFQSGMDVSNLADGTHQTMRLKEFEWTSNSTSLLLQRSF